MNDTAADVMVVKLSSGEMLVASYKFMQDQSCVVLENPVQFDILHSKDGSGSATLLATKWLQTDRKVFTVPYHHIVTTAEPNKIILEHYNESLEEMRILDEEEDLEFEDTSTGSTYH